MPTAEQWPAAEVRAPESGNKDMVYFFSFFGKQNYLFSKLECAGGKRISVHAVVTPLMKMPPLLLTSWYLCQTCRKVATWQS